MNPYDPIMRGCIDGQNIWWVSCAYNGLYKTNIETGKTSFIGYIPFEMKTVRNLYDCIFCIENEILLFPQNTNRMCIYNSLDNAFRFIELEGKVWPVCREKNSIFFLQLLNNATVFLSQYHVGENQIRERKDISKVTTKLGWKVWLSNLSIIGDQAYMSAFNSEDVLIYNLKSDNTRTVRMQSKNVQLQTISPYRDGFVGFEKLGNRVFLFSDKGELRREYELSMDDTERKDLYSSILLTEDAFYIKYHGKNMVFKIDPNQTECNIMRLEKFNGYGDIVSLGKVIVQLPDLKNSKFQFSDGRVVTYKFDAQKFIVAEMAYSEIIQESRWLTLNNYLEAIPIQV